VADHSTHAVESALIFTLETRTFMMFGSALKGAMMTADASSVLVISAADTLELCAVISPTVRATRVTFWSVLTARVTAIVPK
jgi:hypothetical protein